MYLSCGASRDTITHVESPESPSDVRYRMKKSATELDSLSLIQTGVSQAMSTSAPVLRETADHMFSQVEWRKKPFMNKVKQNKSEPTSVSTGNTGDTETDQVDDYPDYESSENIYLHSSDDCEIEPASEKSQRDKCFRKFTDRMNEESTFEADEYFLEKLSIAKESVREVVDIDNNNFLDGVIHFDVNESPSGFDIHRNVEEYRNKEMCTVHKHFNTVQKSGRISKLPTTPFNDDQLFCNTLFIPSERSATTTTYKLQTHKVPPAVECDRKMVNRTGKRSSTVDEASQTILTDIEDEIYNKQENDVENMITSTNHGVNLPTHSENYFTKIPDEVFLTSNPGPECKIMNIVTNDFENTENNSDSQRQNTENGFTRNSSQLRANIGGQYKSIHNYVNANIATTPLSLQPTTAVDTFVNNEENCESRTVKSKSLFTDLQDAGVELRTFHYTEETAAQNTMASGINQRQTTTNKQQPFGPQLDISNKAFKNHNFSSCKSQQIKKRLVVTKKDNVLPEMVVAELPQTVGLAISRDKKKYIKVLNDYAANRKLQLVSNWKRKKSPQKHSISDNKVVDDKNFKCKHESVYSMIDSLQTVTGDFSKAKNNSVDTRQYVGAMRMIDRLLMGPYSKKRKIFSAYVSFQSKNITKTNKPNKIRVNGKRKCRYHIETTDFKTKEVNFDRRTKKCTYNKIITSQKNSLISEHEESIINEYVKRNTDKRAASCNNKKSSIEAKKRSGVRSREILSDAEVISSKPEEQGQTEAETTIDGTRNFQIELPASSSQESPVSIPAGDLSKSVCWKNTAEFEKTQSKSAVSPMKNRSTEYQGHGVVSGSQNKFDLLLTKSLIEKQEEQEEQDQVRNITQVHNMSMPLNTLLTVKEKFNLTSLEFRKKVRYARDVDPPQRVSEGVDASHIIPKSPIYSYISVRTAIKKHKENPSLTRSQCAPTEVIVGLDKTSESGNNIKSRIKPETLHDLQKSFTSRSFPISEISTSAHVKAPASVPKLESDTSKIMEGDVHKSVTQNHGTTRKEVSHVEDSIILQNIHINSSRHSLDSVSRKSIDYTIRNTALVIHPNSGGRHNAAMARKESFIHRAIPLLPLPLAVVCLLLNIVLPGSGTAVSGFLTLCCGQPRVTGKDDQILTTMCVNCMVGLAQLCTVTFLLIGWLWSITWGVHMVILSVERQKELKEEIATKLQTFPMSSFESSKK